MFSQDPDYRVNSRANAWAAIARTSRSRFCANKKMIGVFVLARPTPGPFTPRQIALVQTFADQAVIAIEKCGCSTTCKSEPPS